MRLYYKPGACSMSLRIVLTELGVRHESVEVDTETGRSKAGADYRAINPKGYVPALELDDGTIITENPAILQYLADANSIAGLAPPSGTLERARLQEWLNFTSSELHKAFSPYFSGRKLEGAEKERVDATLTRRIGDVEHGLADGKSYILGANFSVADAYLFVVLNWSRFIDYDLAHFPHVNAYMARVANRPTVRTAMQREGLITEIPA
jgi:glutathione S-transferase